MSSDFQFCDEIFQVVWLFDEEKISNSSIDRFINS